jgi:hypothetical protein
MNNRERNRRVISPKVDGADQQDDRGQGERHADGLRRAVILQAAGFVTISASGIGFWWVRHSGF